MLEHCVEVRDRTIYLTDGNRTIVQRCVNEDTLVSSLDDEWAEEGITSTVVVFTNHAGASTVVPWAATVTIPWELTVDTGYLFVTFVAYAGTQRRLVTERMRQPFHIVESGGLPDISMDESSDEIAYLIDMALTVYESEAEREQEHTEAMERLTDAVNAAADATERALQVVTGGIEYMNLSDDCRARIAASAAMGVEFATEEEIGQAYENEILPAIAAGAERNRLTNEDITWAMSRIFA